MSSKPCCQSRAFDSKFLFLKGQAKKKNQKVLSLQEFNQIIPVAVEAPAPSSINWADEMEKLDDTGKLRFFSYSQLNSLFN